MKNSLNLGILMLFALSLMSQTVFAAPADPTPFDYGLPDGSKITIILEGDEWISWNYTEDEYTILLNKEGFWEYAVKDENDDLVLSGIIARNESDRSSAEIEFLRDLPIRLNYSRSQIEVLFPMHATGGGITFYEQLEYADPVEIVKEEIQEEIQQESRKKRRRCRR